MFDDHALCVPDTRTLLDESIWLFRKNFTLLVTITAAMLAPYAVFSLLPSLTIPVSQMPTSGSLPEFLRMTMTSMGLPQQSQGVSGWLYLLVCQPLAAAAIAVAITERYAQREVNARASIAAALPSLIDLSVAQILLGLILVVVTIPAILCGGLVVSMSPSPLWSGFLTPSLLSRFTLPMIVVGIIGLALLMLPLIVSLRLAFVPQLVVLEQLGPVQSIVRSWRLSTGHSRLLLAVGMALVVLELILVNIPAAALSYGPALSTNGSEIGWMLGSLLNKLSTIIVFPFAIIVYTLLFYSLSLKAMQHDGEQSSPRPPFTLPDDNPASDATSRVRSA